MPFEREIASLQADACHIWLANSHAAAHCAHHFSRQAVQYAREGNVRVAELRRDEARWWLHKARQYRERHEFWKGEGTGSQRQISERFGVSQQLVSLIKSGKRWAYLHGNP